MVRKSVAVFVLMLGGALVSKGDSDPEVAVRILNAEMLRGPLLVQTKHVAGSILASAGIRVRWDRSTAVPPEVLGGCAADGSAMTIAIRINEKAPARFANSAMAAALPFENGGVGIEVFFDRLKPALDLNPRPEIFIGHVLAHEIGHKLLRTNAHSSSGLMKALWNQNEIAGMVFKHMTFTPQHAAAMQENLTQGCELLADRRSVN